MIVCQEAVDAEKYTFKVQGRKISGAEGFMAMFGFKNPNNYLWYNVGGWTNSRDNVEQSIGGNRDAIAEGTIFSVEPDRWYDIQVDVDGDSIRCYLDGRLDVECKAHEGNPSEGVFASTTIDDAAKTMYVKIVNIGDGVADGVINLTNCEIDTDKADAVQLIRLSAEDGGEENTIANPRHIVPVESPLRHESRQKINFDVPAYSANIIKIKLK